MSFDATSSRLRHREKLARIRLIRTATVGPITFRNLVARFGTAEAALAEIPSLARRGGRTSPIKIPTEKQAAEELAAGEALGAVALFLGDPAYPVPLSAIEDAPPVLYALGHRHLAEKTAIAIVGARNASAVGRKIAREIAAELSDNGLVVVSGMARGIDAAAHQGAINGGTIAVLAGGIDVIYPKENESLYAEIKERGLIVSELPPGLRPQARHFPRRNRIISGLSTAVLVVEAARRSGSLITARLAAEQGRDVFAVPGSPLDPRCQGTNSLIRTGASLTESAADILDAIAGRPPPIAEPSGEELQGHAPVKRVDISDALRDLVREYLNPTPIAVDEIIRMSELTVAEVLTILLELELAGSAVRHPGNRVSLNMDN